jgi:hypothetical protein
MVNTQYSWDAIHRYFHNHEQQGNKSHLMLLGCPWLKDAKIIHDWGIDMVIIEGNNIIKT